MNNIYIDFYRIGKTSFHEKVRFYEKYKQHVNVLSFDEMLEIRVDYLIALFEIGKYRNYLRNVDSIIEIVIMENIYEVNGRNVYEDLLFIKAACLFNLQRFAEASNISAQLLKIKPDYPYVKRLFRQCLRRRGLNWYEVNKAIAVVFVLSAISVIITQLLVVEPFYEHYSSHMRIFRNFLVGSSITLLLFNEFWVRRVSNKIEKEAWRKHS